MLRVVLRRRKLTFISRPLLSAFLLASPNLALAQHHGGHGMAGGIPGATGRPTGLDEKDSLKDFHQALAMQATSEQIAEFQETIKATNAAKDKLSAFTQASRQRGGVGSVEEAIESARTGSRKFQESFSEAQKSGLKEMVKRLEKADADVEAGAKRLDQAIQSETGKTDLASRSDALDKALGGFLDEQYVLGREMGIYAGQRR
jgi:exonuclease VII small subunit